MSKHIVLVLLFASVVLYAAESINQKSAPDAIAIPQMLNYQGKLTNITGSPVPDSNYSVTFRLYSLATGGTPFWSETQTVYTTQGLFNVLLGSITPIETIPQSGNCYLEMQVNPQAPMSPRIKITSSAYSYLAKKSDTANYALSANVQYVDSARISANSYNAYKLQGKDTTALSAKFVDEGQVNAITTAMIIDNAVISGKIADNAINSQKIQDYTITRNDVIPNFKAPLSDTADYARATNVVYVDSARIATNAHKLQGKDTLALSAKFVDEGQVNAITTTMINDYAVNNVKIADNSVNSSKIADYSIGTNDIGDYAVTMSKINQSGATTGQVIKWTGSAWAPRNDSVGATGTVTSILQGLGIVCVPNPITATGLVRVDTTWTDNRFINESQTAGGDLVGTYPNPTVDGLQGRAVSSASPATGDVLKWSGTTWGPSTDGLNLPYSGMTNYSYPAFQVKHNLTYSDLPAIVGIHDTTDFYGIGIQAKGGWTGLKATVTPTGNGSYYGVYSDVSGGVGSGTNYGIASNAYGNNTNYGIYGRAEGTSTNPAYGVFGYASGSGSGYKYGVYGNASGSSTKYAGYFIGDVSVTGTMSKGGGSFKIDHPLDPLNKYLLHSFVESPDMMNIYNGNVTTDANGYATIKLPDWFEALNRDFRYQLTVLDDKDNNDFVQVKVVQKIQNNQFTIRTSAPNTEVSWQVTGIRQDKFANANRIPVEMEKPIGERGKYLHPTVYGLSEDQGIGYQRPPQNPEEKK